jgi:hypothetical protein
MKRFVFKNLWLGVMSELALLISGKWYKPLMEGGSRVFPRFVRVGWALLISGLGIAVIGALYSGALEPILHIIEHYKIILAPWRVETNGYYPHFSSPRFPAAIFILIKTNIKIDNEKQQ